MKHFQHIYIFISIIFFLSSCGFSTKKNKDHLVFRYNEAENITSLDPAFSRNIERVTACNQLFSGLVQLDEKLNVLPDIAKNWTISKDLKTYTFNLKRNVFFHKNKAFKNYDQTRKVVANDFSYSLGRLIDPKVASSGRWVMDEINSYTAVNDSTFQIQLKQPFPAFLSLLSMKYCSVIPKEAIDFYGNSFRKNPVGTGPFYFKAWEENVKLVFRKNLLYYEKDNKGTRLPYLEAVAITFLPDKQSEFLQFVQGNLDIMRSIDDSYKDELLTPMGTLQEHYKKSVILNKTPSLYSVYIGCYLDGDDNPLKNKDLRKAINYGFDRKAMITYLRNNIGIPAESGFIPKGLAGYNAQKGYTYQPKKARMHYENFLAKGKSITKKITLSTVAEYVTLCEFIQRELQKIGINIQVEVLPAGNIRKMKRSGGFDLFRGSWIADYPDAENFFIPFIKKNFAPNGSNYTHFYNKTFEKLYKNSFSIPDINERKLIYEKLDSIIIEEAPVIPLFYEEAIRFDRKNIIGVPNNAQNFLYLKTVKKLKVN